MCQLGFADWELLKLKFDALGAKLDANTTALNNLTTEVKNMAADQAALDAAVAALSTEVSNSIASETAVVTAVDDLIAKIQANPGADFTQEITALQSLTSNLTTQQAAVDGAVKAAQAIITPPASGS